ncbi:unnamed protein product [Rotaria magnacalcarata]|uniref:Uncharacterized protein n=1 Tax=Rotaria magnacalcarata TaxID=392030 RepID=A0A8S2S6T9_9BILA|nr:unnamed protein product [Rotaria magnacalcarata]CAF5174774.1 unnamed protein product [Rotaria magnacalcarata]
MESFRLIEHFSHSIEQAGLDLERRYLVANKIDLIEDRKVDEELGQRVMNLFIFLHELLNEKPNTKNFLCSLLYEIV